MQTTHSKNFLGVNASFNPLFLSMVRFQFAFVVDVKLQLIANQSPASSINYNFPPQEAQHIRQHDGHDGEVRQQLGGVGGRAHRSAAGREEENR
jgi:hypothetical protein